MYTDKSQFRSSGGKNTPGRHSAFTLLELAVVLAVIAVFAAMLLPALARSSTGATGFRCLNNKRQLCVAWRMFADDNADQLVPNTHGFVGSGPVSWVTGWLDWSLTTDNTNTALLIDERFARLAPYVNKATNIFKCPADNFLVPQQVARGWQQRVRSVSANIGIGPGNAESGPFQPIYKHINKLSEFLYPTPAETYVFLDEHPDSINDPAFFSPSPSQWVDLPGVNHHSGAAFGFADSHAEIQQWRGSLTKVRGFYGSWPGGLIIPLPGDPDIHWMSYHAPRRGTNSY